VINTPASPSNRPPRRAPPSSSAPARRAGIIRRSACWSAASSPCTAAPAVSIAFLALFFAGLALLIRAYQRHTGMWISGMRRGRTRWLAVATAAVIMVLMLGSIWLRQERGLAWAPVAGGRSPPCS
jgi:hypothetical protein